MRYGDDSGSAPAAAVAQLLESPELHLGRQVAVVGVVVEVCREMGCWFEIESEGRRLLVDLEMGRRFKVPLEITGHRARVEGTFVRRDGVLKLIGTGVEIDPGA